MASQRVKKIIEEAKVEKAKRPYPRPGEGTGRPKGYRVTMATREKIRGAMLIEKLQAAIEGTRPAHLEPHHITAALGLLKFQLPTLQATDITSAGEPLTIERATFKPRTKESGK